MRSRNDGDLTYDRNPDPVRALDLFALARAVQALRYLAEFHTIDVVRHPITLNAHREVLDTSDFPEHVETWLRREALMLGLRGPLPGQPRRGARWAWHLPAVDVSAGKGGNQGPERGRDH